MKKTLLIAALAACVGANAATLTPQEALSRIADGPAKARAIAGAQPTLVFTAYQADEAPAAYVFKTSAERGYMVVAADDVAEPLLGYSSDGVFDPANMPDGLRYWLGQYAEQIEQARANGMAYIPAEANASWTAIAPLVKTKWDQDSPYNGMCPVDNGKRSMTGCVATAMAQVLKYHNYPPKGKGYAGTLDLAKVTFDWDNMLNVYNGMSTTVQNDAVAQLMYACGLSVGMQYSNVSSSASPFKISGALIDSFNYDKNCHMLRRDYVPYDQWQEILYDQLKNIGPVIYGGQASDGGHSFVCDGYAEGGYFHMNWGWSGMSDGYFKLTALDPGTQGIGGASAGFNSSQEMIIGIQKPKEGSKYFRVLQCTGPFTLSKTSTTLGQEIKVQSANDGVYYNATVPYIKGVLGLLLTAANGNTQFVGNVSLGATGIGNSQSMSYYDVKLPGSIAAGTYTVTAAWKAEDTQEVQAIQFPIGMVSEYTMQVSGNNVTLTAISPTPNIAVTDINVVAAYAGKKVVVRAKATNNTKYEFYKQVALGFYATNTADGSKPTYAGDAILLDIVPGTSDEFEYIATMKTLKAGTYTMCFIDPTTYKRYNAGVEVNVVDAPTTYTIEVTNFRIPDNLNYIADKSNLAFEFEVACTEGYFSDKLTIGINAQGASSFITYAQTSAFNLAKGEKTEVQISGSASAFMTMNKYYEAGVYKGTTKSSAKLYAGPLTFYLGIPAGIDSAVADDEAVSVEWYNLQGTRIDAPVPGTVTIRVATYPDGTRRSEKIF